MSLDEACVNSKTVSEVLLKARLSDHVTGPVQLLRISKWLQVTWKYSLYRSYRVYCRHENKCNEVEQRCHPSKRWSDGKPEIIQQNLLTLRTCMLPFQLFSYYWSCKLELYYSGRELSQILWRESSCGFQYLIPPISIPPFRETHGRLKYKPKLLITFQIFLQRLCVWMELHNTTIKSMDRFIIFA